MKIKMKLIFPAAIAAIVFGAFSAAAAANPATPAATGTNAAPAATLASLFGDPVVAKGKGFEIKQSEVDEVVLGIKSAAAAHGETIPPEQMTTIEANMLNRLIQIQLLLQKSTAADKADGKAKADLQISNLLARASSQEAFDRQLKSVGMTPDVLRAKVTQEATATATLTRELGINVTDDQVQQFYNDTNHMADFEQPETVLIRHILLFTIDPTTHAPLPDAQLKAKRQQMDDILKRAKAGEDFAKLATQYSEDPGSKEKGGELPEFPRDAQGVPPELLAAAFSMNPNQISDVITMELGYDIIKLLEKTPAKTLALADKLPPTDMTVSDKIKDFLSQQQIQKRAPAYLDNLKKGADVEILDPDLKAAIAAAAVAAANAPVAPDSPAAKP
jgi:parvulin-like peptidyl-prolyl isomerase